MEFSRFSIGLRFAMTRDAGLTPEDVWQIVFHRVPTTLLTDSKLYGMWDDAGADEPEKAYICLFSSLRLTVGQKLYDLLSTDFALCSYLTAYMPFVQNNRVERCEHVEYLGQIQPNGSVICGDVRYGDMLFTGGKRPIPNRYVKLPCVVVASELAYDDCTSTDAARRICRAAAKAYPNTRILPQRVASGGAGTLDALVAACCGRYMHIKSTDVRCGVLPDRTAILETAGMPRERLVATLEEIRDMGYHSVILAAGEELLPGLSVDGVSLQIWSTRPDMAESEENGVRRCSGLAAVLQYGGFQHLLENAALLVTATNAADSDCAMLDTVADTICYACRTRKIPFAVLARTPEGDFITRINDDAPRKAEETTLDGVAERLFKRMPLRNGRPAPSGKTNA